MRFSRISFRKVSNLYFLNQQKPRIIGREAVDKRLALKDHDYTYNSFQISRLPPTPPPQPAPPPQQLPPPAPLVR